MKGFHCIRHQGYNFHPPFPGTTSCFSAPSGTESTPVSFQARLASSGQAGLLAYGCVNLLYYTVATILATRVFKFNPSALRNATHVEKIRLSLSHLGKLMSVVWLGSQATKLIRIIGAVFLAPFSGRVLEKLSMKYFASILN